MNSVKDKNDHTKNIYYDKAFKPVHSEVTSNSKLITLTCNCSAFASGFVISFSWNCFDENSTSLSAAIKWSLRGVKSFLKCCFCDHCSPGTVTVSRHSKKLPVPALVVSCLHVLYFPHATTRELSPRQSRKSPVMNGKKITIQRTQTVNRVRFIR